MTLFPVFLAALLSARGDDVVARVDQVTITRAMLTRRVEGAARNGMDLDRGAALDSLITDVLLAGEARRIGLGGSPLVASYVEQETRKAAALALVESFVPAKKPDEAMLRATFHGTADFIRYEAVFFASREEAAAALKRIEKGTTLAEEAKTAIASRVFPKPSDSPLVMRAELDPKVGSALFSAPLGTVIGPLEGDNGWLLARVAGKEIGSEAAYASRRAELARSVRQQSLAATRAHVVQQLRVKMGVKLDEAFLRGIKGTQASPKELEHVIATVRGTPVRYVEVYPKIRALGAVAAGHMGAVVKIQYASEIVDERVLEAAAVERGLDKSPAIAGQRPEMERNALAALVADRIRASAPAPTGNEIKEHYRKNAARYGRPFGEVRAVAAAESADEKRSAALYARVEALRSTASISIDKAVLAAADE